MHGGIFCAVFENEDDHSDKLYCKKCGRPGNSVVQTCTIDYQLYTNNNTSISKGIHRIGIIAMT